MSAGAHGVWSAAAVRFRRDGVGMASLAIVALFLLVVIAGTVYAIHYWTTLQAAKKKG